LIFWRCAGVVDRRRRSPAIAEPATILYDAPSARAKPLSSTAATLLETLVSVEVGRRSGIRRLDRLDREQALAKTNDRRARSAESVAPRRAPDRFRADERSARPPSRDVADHDGDAGLGEGVASRWADRFLRVAQIFGL
jgi:hypothetical protein